MKKYHLLGVHWSLFHYVYSSLEFVPTLIDVRKIFNCRMSFKMVLSMCLAIVEKELWTKLWSSNFQNGTFEKTTITVTEIALIQVSFPNVGSKQKNIRTHRIPWHLHTIQKSGLLKIWESHFSLVFIMEFSIISLLLFSDSSNVTNLVDIER